MKEDGDSQSLQRSTDLPLPKLSTPISCPGQKLCIPKCFKSSFSRANTRSFPGANIGSEHDLVLTTIKLKLKTKRFTQNPHIQCDPEKLKDLKVIEVFQAKVGGKSVALCDPDRDVDTLANSLKEVLLSTAEEVLGRQKKKIQPWF